MATEKQTEANRQNAQHSTGATTEAGKVASSRNNFKHGLSPSIKLFTFLADENPDHFKDLVYTLREEHQPQTATESILVQRMAEHEWLRARAQSLLTGCIESRNSVHLIPSFSALYLRYQTTHERAFYKAFAELQKLKEQKTKAEIGFELQKSKQAAEARADQELSLKKEAVARKKEWLEVKKEQLTLKQIGEMTNLASLFPPRDHEMAA